MEEYALVVNVEAALRRDGEYLLVERAADEAHAGGLLAFPGGKVEPPPDGDASFEETARRELYEEVGVDVGAVEYVHSRTFLTDDGTACVNVVTLCEDEGGEAHVRAPEEVAAVRWLSPEAVRDHPDAPAFLERDVERLEGIRAEDDDGPSERVSRGR